MNRVLTCSVLLLGQLAGAGEDDPSAGDVPSPAIRDLTVRALDGELRVSFRVDGAFSQDTLDRLESGIPVTFRHRVEVLSRRPVPLLPSRVLGRTTVEATARYDSLTRQYSVLRRTEREEPEDSALTLEETMLTTASLSEMESWMASVQDVPLQGVTPATSDRKLRVKVKTVLGRRYRFLFPTSYSAAAEQSLDR